MKEQTFSRNIRTRLRGFMDGDQMKIIITARNSLDFYFSDEDGLTSTFSGLCEERRMPAWDEKMVNSFIRQRLRETPVSFSLSEIKEIIYLSKGNPRKVANSCFKLYRKYCELERL